MEAKMMYHALETFYGQKKKKLEISENTKLLQIKELGLDFCYFASFRCACYRLVIS
jgi:hypothetical protein